MRLLSLYGTTIILLSSLIAQADEPTSIKTKHWELGIEISQFGYKEPGLMEETGLLAGLAGSYIFTEPSYIKIDGRYSVGKVNYDGALQDGTPLTISGIPDYIYELRILAVPDVKILENSMLYFGFGYRRLNDNASVKTIYGYERESTYIYFPVRMEIEEEISTFGPKIPLRGGLEFDIFLNGTQISHLSDVDAGFNDIINDQQRGVGWRASLGFEIEKISVELFGRFWNIRNSDKATLTYYGFPIGEGLEPFNHSNEIGLKLTTRF
ncbi:MAG: hypothetical protein HY762_02370 [Planctomycetes bacterium]|nr:hypothetical protein [Planctomycetota bacterium]